MGRFYFLFSFKYSETLSAELTIFSVAVTGCQLIDKTWESFHDVQLKDRGLIWYYGGDYESLLNIRSSFSSCCVPEFPSISNS